ncbi:hypothetical protein Ddye_005886 [Dipteronia dyeriana]|uniref:At2g29880-like C-terminal domain-containing protein n=1 Tax=Dipteronia dyeriana TaxID=168575 RepID=A0AAE0CQN5_9ROSI|nr:hypothetical protein Ddye_005886 [Dipteronia dyeriana]
MRHSSGFGWNPIIRRFTASEEVWEDYLKNTNHADIIEKLSHGIDSIVIDFWGVRSLMDKKEGDREKMEIEKKEKERKCNIWDAIKEALNLDSSARYKALALLNTKPKKKMCF